MRTCFCSGQKAFSIRVMFGLLFALSVRFRSRIRFRYSVGSRDEGCYCGLCPSWDYGLMTGQNESTAFSARSCHTTEVNLVVFSW